MCKRIMFSGASGTGKTTLAKMVEVAPFISSSLSDLIPSTKDMPHKDMLSRDSQTLQMEDYQLLNLRNKLYEKHSDGFTTDRSFLDLAAYFIYKQSDKIPECEVEHFVDLCKMCLNKHCTHLVFIPFTQLMFDEWVTEDNDKRILSKFFQMEISRIMSMVMGLWGYKTNASYTRIPNRNFFKMPIHLDEGWEEGIIRSPYGETKVLTLNEMNLDNRREIIDLWLRKN